MPDNEIINDSTGINDNVPPTDNDNPTENGTDIPVDDDNPIENSTETPDESESADMTDNGAELPDEDEKMPIIFPDNGLEDDFPDEVSADEVSADEQEPEQKPEQKPEPEQEQKPQPEEDNERIMEATTATVGFFAQLREAYQNGENIGYSLGNVLATIREISASRKAEKEEQKQAKIDAKETAKAEKEKRKKEAEEKAREKAEKKAKEKAEKEKAKQDAIATKEDAKLQKAEAKEDKKEAAKEVKKPGFDKLSAVDKVRVNYYTQFISAALKSKHIAIDDATIRSAIVLGVTSLVRDKENGLGHVIKNPDNSKKIIGAICKALTEELGLPMTGKLKFDKETSLDLISKMDVLNQGINKVLEEPRQKIIDQEKAVEKAQRAVKEAEKKLRARQKALESAKKREAKTIETDPEKKVALKQRFDEVWNRLGEIESEYAAEHKGERLGMLLSLQGVTVKETPKIKEYKKLEEESKRINSQLGYGYEVRDEQIRLNRETYNLDEAKRALTSAQGTLDFYHDQLNLFIAPNGNEFAIEHIERLGLNSADTSAESLTDAPADATPSDPTPESDATLEPESKAQDQNNGESTASTTETLTDDTETAPATEESASVAAESASDEKREDASETPVTEENDLVASGESASATEESASVATESASDEKREDASETPVTEENDLVASGESASAAEESASAADGQSQNDAKKPTGDTETASATESASPTQKQPEVNADAQDKEKSDSGATEQPTSNKKPNTMFGQDGGRVNTTGSDTAAEEEAARKAAEEAGEKRGNGYSGHSRK